VPDTYFRDAPEVLAVTDVTATCAKPVESALSSIKAALQQEVYAISEVIPFLLRALV